MNLAEEVRSIVFAFDSKDSRRADVRALADRVSLLEEAARELCGNANRILDRNLGGSYEDDLARSLKKTQALLGIWVRGSR